jgi:hypothetical protein
VAIAAVAIGTVAAVVYARQDLTLSHYDARAHLVVARRITDSLTPGWRQIGGVWLPLPHLLSFVPVQWDWAYRTGYPSVAISVLALALGLGALARFVSDATGSPAAAAMAPALVLLNPSILYLQSTPMTEPLLLGLSLLSLMLVAEWLRHQGRGSPIGAGIAIAGLALTRYEGWCVAAALVLASALCLRRQGWRTAFALVPFLALAILSFLWLSHATTGRWFVASGFFVPDNPAYHRPLATLAQLGGGTVEIGGRILAGAAIAGAALCVWGARQSLTTLLPIALVAAAALPFAAFFQGHPYRVRYMVPIVAASGVLAALALARLPRKVHAIAAVLFVAVVTAERPPFDAKAPMVLEAQWETPLRHDRRAVTQYLVERHDATPILASMGSLGHYMQETSAAGLDIADFVHEGNGDLWKWSLRAPATYVRWVLIEERAEGGDQLAAMAREDPTFLAGFTRVAEGGGLALYRRSPGP